MPKSALGRGLSALLSGSPAPSEPSPARERTDPAGDRVERVPVKRIQPSALQPRRDFSAESLQELADSIREQGLVQPLIVREQNGGVLELIAGERRWRAAQIAGLAEVPVVVRVADDATVLEWMLIENLQRENLNPIEEAVGYSELTTRFALTQDQVAVKVGKSRAAVANALRLLKLEPELQNFVRVGRLSVGHAKVLLGLSSTELQRNLAQRIVDHGLSVRQTEQLVDQAKPASPAITKSAPSQSPAATAQIADLENRLQQRLATKVTLRYRQGKGSLEIRFFTDAELERLLELLGITND